MIEGAVYSVSKRARLIRGIAKTTENVATTTLSRRARRGRHRLINGTKTAKENDSATEGGTTTEDDSATEGAPATKGGTKGKQYGRVERYDGGRHRTE